MGLLRIRNGWPLHRVQLPARGAPDDRGERAELRPVSCPERSVRYRCPVTTAAADPATETPPRALSGAGAVATMVWVTLLPVS